MRLVSAFVRELMMLSSRDSVFFDSPLSNTGIQQVRCACFPRQSATFFLGDISRHLLNLQFVADALGGGSGGAGVRQRNQFFVCVVAARVGLLLHSQPLLTTAFLEQHAR